MATLTVLYSCDVCGLRRVALIADERAVGEDIIAWMDRTVAEVQRDHLTRTPGCPASKLSELMIPTPAGTTRIGEVPRS